MSLGVDDYLAWTPGDMSGAAAWLKEHAQLMDDSASAIRDAAARGTEGQSGPTIESRRADAAEQAERIDELADALNAAGAVIHAAGAALVSAVGRLRDVEHQLLAEGFERGAGERVSDSRTSYEDAAERQTREARAEEFRERVWELLREIRDVDDKANRDLHAVVNRDVRDRTAAGNGDPFAVGISPTSMVAALANAGAAAVKGEWAEAAREAGRGLMQARGLGPVMAGLGFVGAVAARAEDEPLHEAIVAEGIGTLAGAAGAPVGFGLGFAAAGPPGALIGTATGAFGGGTVVSPWVASKVRANFDRAN